MNERINKNNKLFIMFIYREVIEFRQKPENIMRLLFGNKFIAIFSCLVSTCFTPHLCLKLLICQVLVHYCYYFESQRISSMCQVLILFQIIKYIAFTRVLLQERIIITCFPLASIILLTLLL